MQLCFSLAPDQTTLVSVNPLFHKFAVYEAVPQVGEKVRLLLDILPFQDWSDGPGCLFGVVEWDASGLISFEPPSRCVNVELTGTCGVRRGTR